jgi:hypothetical protein
MTGERASTLALPEPNDQTLMKGCIRAPRRRIVEAEMQPTLGLWEIVTNPVWDSD